MSMTIDGRTLPTCAAFHRTIADTLHFPAYYGKNLDALYDVLTDFADTEIVFENTSAVLENLGDYGEKMLRCFSDAGKDSSMLKVIFK